MHFEDLIDTDKTIYEEKWQMWNIWLKKYDL